MTHSIFRLREDNEKSLCYLPMVVGSFASAIIALKLSNNFALSSQISLDSAIVNFSALA